MKQEYRRRKQGLPIFWLGLFIWSLLIGAVAAEELVACKYLKATGKEIQLEVTIASPAPATVIVVQKLPAGVTISRSSPPLKNFNRQRGEAKWLLKGVSPGTLLVALTLDQPLRKGRISGELRYMDPISGAMVTMPFRP